MINILSPKEVDRAQQQETKEAEILEKLIPEINRGLVNHYQSEKGFAVFSIGIPAEVRPRLKILLADKGWSIEIAGSGQTVSFKRIPEQHA